MGNICSFIALSEKLNMVCWAGFRLLCYYYIRLLYYYYIIPILVIKLDKNYLWKMAGEEINKKYGMKKNMSQIWNLKYESNYQWEYMFWNILENEAKCIK